MTLLSDLEAIAQNQALKTEANFMGRAAAIDFITFHILEPLQNQPQAGPLFQRAEALKSHLEALDEQFLQRLRRKIRAGSATPAMLRRQFNHYARQAARAHSPTGPDYDGLDLLVNGLLRVEAAPEETLERDPESVFYQPTPARIVLELIDQAGITAGDIFYDLGSGLGQVPILVSLLTGARSKGIEIEPAYHHYARRCAQSLNLAQVEFTNQDARQTDYSSGTIFFMYTPFTGGMLQTVLEKLRAEARKRPLKLCAYGPCAAQVAASSWLKRLYQNTEAVEDQLVVLIRRTPCLKSA